MLTTTLIAAATLVAATVAVATTAIAADTPPLRDAVECTPRGGLPNFIAKAGRGESLRIAYFGGSITAADGWRPQSLKWLQSQFPNATLSEINAAIGGTGSDLGVFRLQRDVLQHKPDLLFIEFAVNDSAAPVDRIHKAIEGIIRQTWRANSETDICFVYTLTEAMLPELQGGKFPRAASAMEQLADHYAIPSVHMGLEIAHLQKTGQLLFTAPQPKTDADKAALAGKILFSGDSVHPYTDTGHPLYTQALARAFTQLRTVGTAAPHPLPAPMRPDNWEAAKLLPLSAAKLTPGWRRLDLSTDPLAKNFAARVPELYKATTPGETITLQFQGTSLLIYDVIGPDCGQVAVTVDGQRRAPVPRFDPWCTWHRLAMLPVATDLPDGLHTVTIELLPGQPDKLQILHQNKSNTSLTQLDPAKYNDTAIYPAALLLIGDLK